MATLIWWVGRAGGLAALVLLHMAFPSGWLGLREGGLRIARGRNRSPFNTWLKSPRMLLFLYPIGQSKPQGQP